MRAVVVTRSGGPEVLEVIDRHGDRHLLTDRAIAPGASMRVDDQDGGPFSGRGFDHLAIPAERTEDEVAISASEAARQGARELEVIASGGALELLRSN